MVTHKYKDWSGIKVKRLTFIKRSHVKVDGRTKWEALCDCGNTAYVFPNNVVNGSTQGCGCLISPTQSARAAAQRKYPPHISSAKHVFKNYKDGNIDFDTFYNLSQLPCDYCLSPPMSSYNIANTKVRKGVYVSEAQIQDGYFTYNGLDRVDNTMGHTIDNVVPCCRRCNTMKLTLTREQFIEHIGAIYRRFNPPDTLR